MRPMNATITKIQDAQPMGEYKPTALDARKEAATVRLIQCSPYVVRSKVELSGRGVKRLNTGLFQLSDAAWSKVGATHTCVCDF